MLKACIGLPPDHNMTLEHKLPKRLFSLDGESKPEIVTVSQTDPKIPEEATVKQSHTNEPATIQVEVGTATTTHSTETCLV